MPFLDIEAGHRPIGATGYVRVVMSGMGEHASQGMGVRLEVGSEGGQVVRGRVEGAGLVRFEVIEVDTGSLGDGFWGGLFAEADQGQEVAWGLEVVCDDFGEGHAFRACLEVEVRGWVRGGQLVQPGGTVEEDVVVSRRGEWWFQDLAEAFAGDLGLEREAGRGTEGEGGGMGAFDGGEARDIAVGVIGPGDGSGLFVGDEFEDHGGTSLWGGLRQICVHSGPFSAY